MKKEDVLSILRQYMARNQDKYSITNLGFFGSASRDSLDEQSDIDVVVELENPDMFNLIGIKQDLEAKLNRPVDILRYREKMNPFLKRRIEAEAIYV